MPYRSLLKMLLCTTALVSCDTEKRPTGIEERRVLEEGSSPETHLPYGTPVPLGSVLSLPPEPYDSRKHGAGRENSMPWANLVGRMSLPPRGKPGRASSRGRGALSAAQASHESVRGYNIFNTISMSGIYAGNELRLDLTLPFVGFDDTLRLYAPTHQSAGNSCIEAVTVHRQVYISPGLMPIMRHEMGFWNWCDDQLATNPEYEAWVTLESMSLQSWQNAYARGSDPMYYFTVVKSSDHPGQNCWKALLFNFLTGEWENKLPDTGNGPVVCGTVHTAEGQNGWTLWEPKYDAKIGCPVLPEIRSQQIHVCDTSTMTWVSLANRSPSPRGSSLPCWEDAGGPYNWREDSDPVNELFAWNALTD